MTEFQVPVTEVRLIINPLVFLTHSNLGGGGAILIALEPVRKDTLVSMIFLTINVIFLLFVTDGSSFFLLPLPAREDCFCIPDNRGF